MGDFFEEYKKRSIYGDALGPPTNATQSAALELIRLQKGYGVSGPASRDFTLLYYKGEPVTTSFRFAWRRSLAYLIGGLVVLAICARLNITRIDILMTAAMFISIPAYIAAAVGTFRVGVNLLFFTLSAFFFLWKLFLRAALLGSISGLFATLLLPSVPIYAAMIIGAVIGGAVSILRKRKQQLAKESA